MSLCQLSLLIVDFNEIKKSVFAREAYAKGKARPSPNKRQSPHLIKIIINRQHPFDPQLRSLCRAGVNKKKNISLVVINRGKVINRVGPS